MSTDERTAEQKQADYQAAVAACRVSASMLAQCDLPELLAAIERADSFGPLLDPTLWRDKREAMYQDREILKAALPLWKLGRKLSAMAKEPT